jgi:lantibiotic biosynthesis protein
MLGKEKRFPLLFGRKGGGKLNLLDEIKSLNFEPFLKEINRKKLILEKKKHTMVYSLHKAIGNEKKDVIKKILLNYKRDLFNGRNLDKYELRIKNKELKKNLINFNELTQVYLEKIENFRLIFDGEILQNIEELKEITETTFFKNGILFSSEVLYNQINKTDFRYIALNKKNKKLVSSVLKYLTRSVAKTTPYSSFNNIFCLKYDKKNHYINKIQKDYSSFQIINLFYYYLKLFLLEKKEFKNTLEVYTNSTISIKKEFNKINYFFNKENNESFKNIDNNQILDFILNFLNTNTQTEFGKLIVRLKEVTEESEENIINYIEILVNEGFLILKYPVSPSSQNWICKLKNYLSKIHFSNLELKENLLFLLNYIQDSEKKIAITIDVECRKKILKKTYQVLISFFKEYSLNPDFFHKIKEKDLFYENTISSIKSKIATKSLDKLSNDLINLQNGFSKLLSHKKELKEFLVNFLTEDKKNILEFYEEVYLKKKQSFSYREKSLARFDEMVSQSVSVINSSKNIDELDISVFCEPFFFRGKDSSSFGVYFQTVNNNLDRVVINNFSNGNGSNVSRFLISFPNEYSKDVKEYNKNRDSKTILTEVKDASINNTNIFPPLCDSLIIVNEDLTLKNCYRYISLKNIFISKNDFNELILTNEKGVEIEPQIFSLEGIIQKSKFTQFLEIFNKTDNSGFSLYLNSLNNNYKSLNKNISVIPRLVFKDKIVIQRKKWFVKKEFLLGILNKKTLAENFLSINVWIKRNKIPSKIFIKIMEQDFKNGQNDNYKPQFIDFESPIFMLLIINLIKKSEETIELTEMYPNSNNVEESGGYVKEYVININ